MIEDFKENEITVHIPNGEQNLFMDIAEHQNCVIQRYYWRSLADKDYIEEIEPKIIDAFEVVITIRGLIKDLNTTVQVFKEKIDLYRKLPNTYIPLTANEIRNAVAKFLTI